MKIAIVGYSGSGKSTLAQRLGERFGIDVLHLDFIKFGKGWVEREDEMMMKDLEAFLEKDSWIIDGTYSRFLYERRMNEAELIVFLSFNRVSCLWRVVRRYGKYKGTVRPDLGEGCKEKLDLKFIRWILFDSRSKKAKEKYKALTKLYGQKLVIIKNQRQLDRFLLSSEIDTLA